VLLLALKRFHQIEDEIRTRAKNELLVKQKVSANIVASKSYKDFSKKMKKFNKKNQNLKNLNVQKEFKKTDMCFNCDNEGHFAKACKAPKKEEKEEAHNINQVNNFVVMLFQVISPSNDSDWGLDTGATCHVCSNKDFFSTYVAVKENMSMAYRFIAVVL